MSHQETPWHHVPTETKQTEGLAVETEQQEFDFQIQPASSFLSLPAEICNKIYELAFEWDEDNIDPFDTKRLQPLLTCKQVYTEAHVVAYTSLWHRIRLNAPSTRIPERQALLRPSTRKLIHRLWLDVGSVQAGSKEWDVAWTLDQLDACAASLRGLGVAALHVGALECFECGAAFWRTRCVSVAVVAQRLVLAVLALVRAWPTLKELWIVMRCPRPRHPHGATQVQRELWRAVLDSRFPNYRFLKIPVLRSLGVLDSEWVNWADGWIPGSFKRPLGPNVSDGISGICIRGRRGALVEGRAVEIGFGYISMEPDRYSRELLTMRRKYSVLDCWDEGVVP